MTHAQAIITPERVWINTATQETRPYEGAPIPSWYNKEVRETGKYTAYDPVLGKVQRGLLTREQAIELTKLWVRQ